MNKDEILEVMSEAEGNVVSVVDAKGETIEGTVFLFESRYDNEEDEECAGEASICLKCENDDTCMLYESDIKSIKVAE